MDEFPEMPDMPADEPIDTAPEGGGESAPVAAAEPSPPAEPGAAAEKSSLKTVLSNGTLSPEAKSAVEKLRAENPQFAEAVRKALFAEDRFQRALPGGLKEISDLRSRLEQYGGEVGLNETYQEVDGWRQFDQLYTAGDPKVFDFLTESPEAKQAFLKLAPAAFERYREVHPDGYNGYIAQVLADTLEQNEVPMAVMQLGMLLKDNPEALAIVQQIYGFLQSVKGLARKPVEMPKLAAPAADTRETDLARRETMLRRTEWGAESNQTHAELFSRQWRTQIGERKLSDVQTATVKELYGLKLAQVIKNDPDFNRNLEGYFAAHQKAGFLKYFRNFYEQAVPKALRAAILQTGLGQKPGPKPPGVAQTANGGPVRPPVAERAPAPGFAVIGAKPDMSMVNRNLTTPEMWQNRRAVLVDGRRVTWRG